jgi:hypothetical protein
MGYTISGTYIAACDCRLLCPCPVDGTPTGPEDQCHGAAAFRIDRGNLDDVDLSGVKFALINHFPSNITSGNWKMGIVVDAGSDDQAQAVERIISGQAGGVFAEFTPLIGEYTGMQRGSVDLSDKGATIEGVGEVTYDQIQGPDGEPTVSRNAMFAFAPEFRLGRTSGTYDTFGSSRQASYGESAEFEYSSEGEGQTARA